MLPQPGTPPTSGPSPFSLSDPAVVRTVLTGAGFVDVTLTDLRELMWFGHDTDDAFEFVTGQFAAALAAMAPPQRARAEVSLRETLKAHENGDGVRYASAAWLVRARRP